MTPPDQDSLTGPRAQEGFAQVSDLALARASAPETGHEPVIPVTVLEEMEAASRMFQALHAQGHELRFESDAGQVRAELRTVGGDVVRPVSLREAVDVTGGPDFAA